MIHHREKFLSIQVPLESSNKNLVPKFTSRFTFFPPKNSSMSFSSPQIPNFYELNPPKLPSRGLKTISSFPNFNISHKKKVPLSSPIYNYNIKFKVKNKFLNFTSNIYKLTLITLNVVVINCKCVTINI